MQATFAPPPRRYPVRVEGHLDDPSRALWLIKWLLVIPHYIVLALLWLGFCVSACIGFVAVLFTGRYPRALFDYNAGVMRWTWRVSFYAFGANGTDRYPPFTLDDVPDYPGRLAIDYPEHQRRGLPLIGWWLAGIPQYLIAGVFLGGGAMLWSWTDQAWRGPVYAGVIDLLVFASVVVLLFRGQYPRSIFNFVLGLNRWVLRALAYAAVMTPEYPPFRVDIGETEPSGTITIPVPDPSSVAPSGGAAARQGERWGVGRVIGLVLGGIVGLGSLGLLAGGVTAIVLDQTQRDSTSYLMTSTHPYSTSTYALVSASYRGGASGDWFVNRDLIGPVKVRVASTRPVFIGIAPEGEVNRYLAGVAQARGDSLSADNADFHTISGSSPTTPPSAERFWAASSTDSGQQTLTWKPRSGNWRIVLMNADGSAGVRSGVSIGARMPHLLAIGIAGAGAGLVLLLMSATGFYLAARRRTA